MFRQVARAGIIRENLQKVSNRLRFAGYFNWFDNNQDGGSQKKKHTTKIHDAALGNPLKIILTGSQVHDVTIAQELIAGIKADIVMADGAHDSDTFREHIRKIGACDCIVVF